MPEIEIPQGVVFVKSEGGIQEYRLESNGLRILLSEDHSSPVAAVMVSYGAGSRDEVPHATGAAHILEHMMFKGTEKYNKKKGTQIAKLIEQTGALINANTGYDSTNYYELVPSDSIDLALDIEASRMRGTLLDKEDFESERNVVLNELERYFDSPVVELMTAVWNEAFDTHPYGHPVIGWREDVKSMPVESLKKFYDTYYWPENATLSLIGDFKSARILEKIALKFSAVPQAKVEVPPPPKEPPQEAPREVQIKKTQGAEFVLLANKIPGSLHPDSIALDLLGMILSHGKTSRLHRALVEKGLAAQVEAGGSGTKDPGLFTTMATLSPSIKHDTVVDAILEVYKELAKDGVSDAEFDRAKSQIRAEAAYARDGALSVATELSQAIGIGDWTYYSQYLSKIEKVKKQDIKEAAALYLTEKTRTTGRLSTEQPTLEGAGTAAGKPPSPHERVSETPEPAAPAEAAEIEEAVLEETSAAAARQARGSRYYEDSVRTFEENGVKLLALRTGVKDMVAISGSMAGGGTAYHEAQMVPRLTMMMLDQGTRDLGKYEIAEQLENRGAQILFGVDPQYMRFQIRCLREDLDAVVRLFAEELLRPSFNEKEFGNIKQQERVRLQYMMSSTSAQGLNAFLRSVFPADHALYAEAFEEQIASLDRITTADLKAFHEANYGKGELIFSAAGDLDPDALWKSLQNAFSGWKTAEIPGSFRKDVPSDFHGEKQYVPVKERGNMDIIMGRPVALQRDNPHYVPAYLANYILGGDFTSRLSSVIRDQYGLTYGIRSGFIGMTEEIQGAWVVHMIVTPPNLEEGVRRTLELVSAFREAGIDAVELEIKKRTVVGRFKIGLATSRELADELLTAEQWGFGPAYLDRFPARIESVSTDQVNEAVRRYYNPDALQIIASGDLPEDSDFAAGSRETLKKDNP